MSTKQRKCGFVTVRKRDRSGGCRLWDNEKGAEGLVCPRRLIGGGRFSKRATQLIVHEYESTEPPLVALNNSNPACTESRFQLVLPVPRVTASFKNGSRSKPVTGAVEGLRR